MNKDNKYDCPFCGNKCLEVKRNSRYNDWHTYCDICFACGPSAATPEEASKKWRDGIDKIRGENDGPGK